MSKLRINKKKVGCIVILFACLIAVLFRTCSTMRNKKQQEKEVAASLGCITLDSLNCLDYSYLYENKLPCLVYLNSISVEDIATTVDEAGQERLPNWIGNPTSRANVGWIKIKSTYFHSYIGFDSIQAERVLQNAKESKTIKTPMVIRVYQVSKIYDNHISYKADLVSFCEDGGDVCKFLSQSDSLSQYVMDTLDKKK